MQQKKLPSDLLFIFFILIQIFIVCGIGAFADADQIIAPTLKENALPWHIIADRITYDKKENIYTATGKVVIQKDDKTLSANTVKFNRDSMEAFAMGNVLIEVNDDRLSGDRVDINLNTGTGSIEKGTIFIKKNHFIIKGDKIEKIDKSSYFVNKGSFTTCDGESPAWHITGKDLNMTLEDYGTVKHATVWAKEIPVAYVPYLVFPVKIRRQSGLLPPRIGYSDRNGAQFMQPFYWAINRNSDATLYFHHIQNRGEKIGSEYRYALDLPSKGTLMIDSLNDQKIDDGTGNNSEQWGYPGDKAIRPNSDRYWFRMKADQSLPYQLTTKLDLDVVSDQDYLRDFSDGYTGYNDTKKYFESEFGRDIDDKNDPVRENNLNINRIWTVYSFTTDVNWNDNVINRRQKDTDPTLQRLPDTQFYGLKQPLLGNLCYIDLGSEYTYFYRQEGQTGHRGNLYPRLYLPYHYKQYIAFEPSIGFLQTNWYVDQKDPQVSDMEAHQNRQLYDIRSDLSTDISKIFDINGKTIDKIKHTIIPKAGYEYTPNLDQSEFPHFDELDDIDPKNSITFSITNLITSKEKIDDVPDSYSKKQLISPYHQLCRFLIEQPYALRETSQSDETPFGPLYAELDLSPSNYFTLGTETEWSHETGKLMSNNIFNRFSDIRGDRLLIEHRYLRTQSQSIYFDCIGVLTQSISIYGEYERNIEENRDISKSIGWLYHVQCWSVELGVEHEDNDKKIGFMINLYGLGGVGNPL